MLALAENAIRDKKKDASLQTPGPATTDEDDDITPRVLSIGAGDGHFDLELFRRLNWTPRVYVAIEPTKDLTTTLRYNSRNVNFPVRVVETPFATSNAIDFYDDDGCGDDDDDGRFDVVLLSHCLYCFPDPADVLNYCRDELLPRIGDGRVLVWCQTCEGYVHDLVSRFGPRMAFVGPSSTFGDHSVTQSSLMERFEEGVDGMRFEVFVDDASHLKVCTTAAADSGGEEMTAMTTDYDDSLAVVLDELISFALLTNVRDMADGDLAQEIRAYARSLVKGGRLKQPSSLIVCEKL